MKPKLMLAIVVAAATGTLTHAHHSLVANYRLDKTIVIEGRLVQFLFRNPHSFVQVEVPKQPQQIENRIVEWRSAGQLVNSAAAECRKTH